MQNPKTVNYSFQTLIQIRLIDNILHSLARLNLIIPHFCKKPWLLIFQLNFRRSKFQRLQQDGQNVSPIEFSSLDNNQQISKSQTSTFKSRRFRNARRSWKILQFWKLKTSLIAFSHYHISKCRRFATNQQSDLESHGLTVNAARTKLDFETKSYSFDFSPRQSYAAQAIGRDDWLQYTVSYKLVKRDK